MLSDDGSGGWRPERVSERTLILAVTDAVQRQRLDAEFAKAWRGAIRADRALDGIDNVQAPAVLLICPDLLAGLVERSAPPLNEPVERCLIVLVARRADVSRAAALLRHVNALLLPELQQGLGPLVAELGFAGHMALPPDIWAALAVPPRPEDAEG